MNEGLSEPQVDEGSISGSQDAYSHLDSGSAAMHAELDGIESKKAEATDETPDVSRAPGETDLTTEPDEVETSSPSTNPFEEALTSQPYNETAINTSSTVATPVRVKVSPTSIPPTSIPTVPAAKPDSTPSGKGTTNEDSDVPEYAGSDAQLMDQPTTIETPSFVPGQKVCQVPHSSDTFVFN